jgi:hypothetical protein
MSFLRLLRPPRPVTTPIDSHPTDRPTARREFLGQIAASAIVIAGTACAAPATAGQTTAPSPAPAPGSQPATPAPTPTHWDDSWFAKLTAKHKAVFDSPAIDDGLAVFHASGYIGGMWDALGAGVDDVQIVLVMRHAGVPMVLNDAMWAKYEIGKERKIKDYSNDKFATRNPFFAAPAPANGAPRATRSSDRPQATLSWLGSHGHILLGCDLATRGLAFSFAEKTKGDQKAIYEELKANLVPGVILQPTGVYAVHRAQEAGCTFIRST